MGEFEDTSSAGFTGTAGERIAEGRDEQDAELADNETSATEPADAEDPGEKAPSDVDDEPVAGDADGAEDPPAGA